MKILTTEQIEANIAEMNEDNMHETDQLITYEAIK